MKKSFSILILFFFLSISAFGQKQQLERAKKLAELETRNGSNANSASGQETGVSNLVYGEIYEEELEMSKGNAHSFSIDFANYSKKGLEYEWKKFIKSLDAKVKKDKKTKELVTENIIIKEISDKTLSIYATVVKIEETITIHVFFYMDTAFLKSSEKEKEPSAIYDFLNDFSSSVFLSQMKIMEREKAEAEAAKNEKKKTGVSVTRSR